MSTPISISKKERGAIAIIAAIVMPLFILITLVMAQVGVLRVDREEVEGTADSLALAYANQIVVNPGPQVASGAGRRGPTIESNNPFLVGGGSGGNHCINCVVANQQITAPTPTAYSKDGYHPYTSVATVTRARDTSSLLSQAFTRFVSNASQFQLDQEATARAWVPQVGLTQFTLLKQPLMLVVDYSGGFQLPMKNETQPSVVTVQQTVRTIVGDTMRDKMKLGMADVFNFGLVMFSSDPSEGVFHPLPDAQTLSQSQAVNEQQQDNDAAFISALLPSNTLPDDPLKPGTNLQAPIDLAVSILNSYDFGSPETFGVRPSMMIVTDGLPNLYNGGGGRTSYEDASNAARASTQAAWNNQTPAQGTMAHPPGIATYTIKVDRLVSSTNRDESGQDAKMDTFFQDISGSKSDPRNSAAYITVDSGGAFMDALHSIPVITHCVSSPLSDFTQGPENGQSTIPVPRAVWPTAQDVLAGYFVQNKFDPNEQERNVGRAMSYDELVQSDGEGDQMNYNYGDGSSSDVDASQPLFRFFFDPGSMRIVLNGHLCNQIQQLRAQQKTDYQFRLRWSPVVMSCGAKDLAGCHQLQI